jgi:hypothetical protein
MDPNRRTRQSQSVWLNGEINMRSACRTELERVGKVVRDAKLEMQEPLTP